MNNMSDDKKFTWGQLREFCNSLSEEQLSFPVMVAAVDGLDFSEYVTPVISPPMYRNINDYDDVFYERDFLFRKESGEIKNIEEYEFIPGGYPFLCDEFIGAKLK
jgi:hypothetical protein